MLSKLCSARFPSSAQNPTQVVADVWKKRCLALPGHVWELRFLPSFPAFHREIRTSKNVWGKRLEVADILLPDIRGLLTYCFIELNMMPIKAQSAFPSSFIAKRVTALDPKVEALRRATGPFPAGPAPEACDIVSLLQEPKRPLPRKLRKKSEKGFPSLPARGQKNSKKDRR